jgi:hypothetical protein
LYGFCRQSGSRRRPSLSASATSQRNYPFHRPASVLKDLAGSLSENRSLAWHIENRWDNQPDMLPILVCTDAAPPGRNGCGHNVKGRGFQGQLFTQLSNFQLVLYDQGGGGIVSFADSLFGDSFGGGLALAYSVLTWFRMLLRSGQTNQVHLLVERPRAMAID